MQLPTVEIVNPSPVGTGKVIINESDYDPSVHTLWEDRDAGDVEDSAPAAEEATPATDEAPETEEAPPETDEYVDDRFGSNEAKELAALYGLAADDIPGTGKGGKILLRDVKAMV